jgi:hypothetical protein
LKIKCIWYREFWDVDLLEKQKDLEEFSLDYCDINEFKFDAENCHIEKLTIETLEFLNDRAFDKFSEFMKIQESVRGLKLSFIEDELMNRNYAEILTHLLSLKSLKKFTVDCADDDGTMELFQRLKICNPAVDTLTILNPEENVDLSSFPKFFPNVTDLKIIFPDTLKLQ